MVLLKIREPVSWREFLDTNQDGTVQTRTFTSDLGESDCHGEIFVEEKPFEESVSYLLLALNPEHHHNPLHPIAVDLQLDYVLSALNIQSR
mmetsp:Transcript_12227/g.24951  ORF Transcript_12227/g.24951 Transcript_12227/m.24951 type:complete len:91 (+) Transcript_12227:1177-1449(+)